MRRTLLVIAAILMAGCSSNRTRYHDVGHNDDHAWNRQEMDYYSRWEIETHRDHREFSQRDPNEQQAYFDWRHSHDSGRP